MYIMVLRFDTHCPRCHKDNSVFGHERVCDNCKFRGFFKGQIKAKLRERGYAKELKEMKEPIKKKLHDEILKEILEEQKSLK